MPPPCPPQVQRKRDLDARYTLIAEENRFLYNTVQDLRGNIRVFCRVRPRGATGDGSTGVVEVEEDQLVNVFSHKHNKWHQYKFDRVFGEESTQDDVYEETKPLIRSVLDGGSLDRRGWRSWCHPPAALASPSPLLLACLLA